MKSKILVTIELENGKHVSATFSGDSSADSPEVAAIKQLLYGLYLNNQLSIGSVNIAEIRTS
jgi:hypothetical protein